MENADFADLTPDAVLTAVEACGYLCDGRFLALNSYENRVYQIGIEDSPPIVAKFYRPNRWTNEAIQEEHDFAAELIDAEIPVVAPLADDQKNTLHHVGAYRVALYKRQGGRRPELDAAGVLSQLGRFLGRIHMLGAREKFIHRPQMDIATFGEAPGKYLLESDWIPNYLRPAYASVVEEVLIGVRACFERAGAFKTIRLHGDCHPSNILWTDSGPHFVDLDDCCNGPAIQDLWMLLDGDREDMTRQLGEVLSGYEDFCEFDPRELNLLEALRSLRLIHYSAWLARRWNDPAFPLAFPWFEGSRYWETQILSLREQIALMQEPPLYLF